MARNENSSRRRSRRGDRNGPALYAALDLGTNNCRLLVAERADQSFRVVDSFSRIVRLGEGLAATGRLSDQAMDRAVEALKVCRAKLRKNRVSKVRCITTQACRSASNGAEFIKRIQSETGLGFEPITPKEEAKLALLGSLDLIDDSNDFVLVVDIGGGSTELSWVDARAARRVGVEGCAQRPPILGWASFPVGVVTLSETSPEFEGGWFEEVVERVRDLMKDHDAVERFGPLFRAGRGHMLGTSGTVTSLAALQLRLPKYNRSVVDGSWMTAEEVRNTTSRLLSASPEERAAEPCIGPDRADLVLAGCAILEAVWSFWPAERLRAADRGLREGVLLSLIHGKKSSRRKKNNRRRGSNKTARPHSGDATGAET